MPGVFDMTIETGPDPNIGLTRDDVLEQIQDRVLWIAMQLVHHANSVRPNPDGTKVGGHQSSSSSVVTLMTSLYFDFLKAGDRVAVKPHASPVFHAIQYLLGNLDPKYLTEMRAFHGLQAYPSRTKDPDQVDFSTGSVGLGPVAPNFAALADEYIRSHIPSDSRPNRRYISVVGDAELDEGSVWEAIAEPAMTDLSNVIWVVDLNRQSLDRIIPGIRVSAWRKMFDANGWTVIDAKYGKKLQAKFAEPNGELLRMAIDEMSNEVYQRLLRVNPAQLREWLPNTSRYPRDMTRLIGRWDDAELEESFRNLGGHDFAMLREAFARTENQSGPNVVFAYTLKGWKLPTVGDPQNHSVTLSESQMDQVRERLGVSDGERWSRFPADSPAGRRCEERRMALGLGLRKTHDIPDISIPNEFGQPYTGNLATQQTFGLILTAISRDLPEVSDRVVTVSPDVASSTNLGGWINKVGVWQRVEQEPLPDDEIVRSLRWEENAQGQHVELGISENNLFMMLGQLGSSFEVDGDLLFPIGTLYDPFIRRGLDAFVYGVYSGAKFIVVGTPSGVSLSPEGGAHQSQITPSIGIEMPDLDFYEPCFAQELEWVMLAALEQLRVRGRSTYLRLTSKRVDQSLLTVPKDTTLRESLRRQVLDGAYRLVDRSNSPGYAPGENVVHILASGAMVPEAVSASDRLLEEGVHANVINVTGAGPLYRSFQQSVTDITEGKATNREFMTDSIPEDERSAPLVTVADGHPHSLAWIGSALKTAALPLGVTEFGQSGTRADLYREYKIDAESIVATCYGALEL
jgi:pyruvate dehydrogenase E1 component|tara:strand:- start:12064 stop:14463 length:2400 start_codon:yes stop_codon:yes gene_type:complete